MHQTPSHYVILEPCTFLIFIMETRKIIFYFEARIMFPFCVLLSLIESFLCFISANKFVF